MVFFVYLRRLRQLCMRVTNHPPVDFTFMRRSVSFDNRWLLPVMRHLHWHIMRSDFNYSNGIISYLAVFFGRLKRSFLMAHNKSRGFYVVGNKELTTTPVIIIFVGHFVMNER